MIKSYVKRLRDYIKYPEVVSVTSSGSTVKFRVTNNVERYRAAGFGGEEEFLTEFLRHVEPESTVWDVGANIGLFALFAASNGANIHAFEPESNFRSQLERNIALNGLSDRVHVHKYALGKTTDTVTLYTDGIDGDSPSLASDSDGKRETEQIQIHPGTAVDAPQPDHIKIDVEGAEHNVLLGLDELLTGAKTVALEVHPKMIRQYDATPDEPVEYLEQHGFKIVWENRRNEQRQLVARRQSDS